ncbi:putative flagellar antigen [Trypanosoma conorhini]|uniref:Putative flagellar antigen n=1 Tax=Trypanosoma conorhini TaxID=83891 RepID=A0A422NWB8_9TRYP|nr:putative flagellar antigen [Trypanosoma conorhini]RNF09751.1 putative flagellar antigen [Trypanosoma conorhini]
MFSATAPVGGAVEHAQQPLRPARPTTARPTKPDYFSMSLVRKPMGPSIYPGAAAAEDASKGLLLSDAMHDMNFYTGVCESLPDAGRPVLNSVLFSQRHVVNDTPSVEEEIASINERMRLWRASRLQEVITNYEHTQEQALLDEKVEERIRARQQAEQDRAVRRISRMLDSLIPELEKMTLSEAATDVLGTARREALHKQWKERDELQQRLLREMRLAERHRLVDLQFQRNVEERNSLESQHYYSYLAQKMDERLAFRQLCEAFYDEKIIVGVTDDETVVRQRMQRLELEDRIYIIEQMRSVIGIKESTLAQEANTKEEETSLTFEATNTQETEQAVTSAAKAETAEHVEELVKPVAVAAKAEAEAEAAEHVEELEKPVADAAKAEAAEHVEELVKPVADAAKAEAAEHVEELVKPVAVAAKAEAAEHVEELENRWRTREG